MAHYSVSDGASQVTEQVEVLGSWVIFWPLTIYPESPLKGWPPNMTWLHFIRVLDYRTEDGLLCNLCHLQYLRGLLRWE